MKLIYIKIGSRLIFYKPKFVFCYFYSFKKSVIKLSLSFRLSRHSESGNLNSTGYEEYSSSSSPENLNSSSSASITSNS